MLGGDPQQCPARGHNPKGRAALNERRHVGCGSDDLFHVVEEKEGLPVPDKCDNPLAEGPALGFLHVQPLGHRGNHIRVIADVGQWDKRHAVEKLGRKHSPELEEHGGLPDPAGPCDRDDPVSPGEVDEGLQVDGSAEEGRTRFRQAVRKAGEPFALALERRRLRDNKTVALDRVELERAPHVLQPEPPKRDHADITPVLDLVVDGIGQHHSAGSRERLDPRRDVHGFAREPLVFDDYLTDVDAEANRNVLRRELALNPDRSLHRRERTREHAHAPVTEPLHDRPAKGVVMSLERSPVPLALLERRALVRLHQRRVADHVGEHHRDEPTVEPLTHGSTRIPRPGTRSSARDDDNAVRPTALGSRFVSGTRDPPENGS